MPQKSIFDLDENIVAALSYLLGPFTGIAVLILEKENKFVRFHALQSTLWFLMLMVIGWVIGFVASLFTGIPFVGWAFGIAFGGIFSIGTVIYILSKIFLMLRAYNGATCKIPIIGDVVWAQINKGM